MDVEKETALDLACLLRDHQDEILSSWMEQVHQLPDSRYRGLSVEDFRDWMKRGLRVLAEILTTGSYAALEGHLTHFSSAGMRMGIASSSMVECLLLCKGAIISVMQRTYPFNSARTWALLSQLDACLHGMVCRFHEVYSTEMNGCLQEQPARMRLLLDMAVTASSTLNLDEVFSRVAQCIATAAGVPYCGFFLVDVEQGMIDPKLGVTVPLLRNRSFRVGVPEPSSPQPIAAQGPFLRQVISQKEPLTCYDAQTDPRFDQGPPSRWAGYRSILAVPLVIGGRVVAIAFAFTCDKCCTFTEEQIDLVSGLANVGALAIENARLHQQVKQVAIVEERNRLARELHDTLAQMLGAMQMKASHAYKFLSDGLTVQARADLLELQTLIDQAFSGARAGIHDLRFRVTPGQGFLAVLQEYLVDCQAQYGMDIRLESAEEDQIAMPWAAQLQAIRIVQEALTNVRKHSGTGTARVCANREGNWICISVEDDGLGFDLAGIGSQEQQSIGLQVMDERAKGIGGTLIVDSHPGQGTRIVLRVPLSLKRVEE